VSRVLAVCGLRREAAIWGGPSVCGGGNETLLAERLERGIAEHAPEALLSFGVAGALDPALGVGEVILASAVVTPKGERFETDDAWLAKIERAVGGRKATLVGASKVAATIEDKAALLRFGAAVDMESHVMARAAARHGMPFAVLRVISDAADEILPPSAVAGMREDGEVDVLAVLSQLAKHPRQLAALLRTGRNAERAFRRLEEARKQLAAA
jgi:hopanoid-associated phosphorylase